LPTSEHGALEGPKKSAYSLEFYDSSWERDYMEKLEAEPAVAKWTKNHGIRIPYYDNDGAFHTYTPDFLVEMADGTVELHEVKGTQFLGNPITRRKFEAATKFCKARKMVFRAISRHKG
jgi:restriction endonuclease